MQRNGSDCRGEKKARPIDSGWADVIVHSSKGVMHASLPPVLFVTLLDIQDCFTCLATLVKQRDMEESNEKKPKNKPGAQPPHDLHRHKAPRADLGLRLGGFVVRKRTAPLHTIQHHSIQILSITPSRYISYLSPRVPGLLLTDNPQSSTIHNGLAAVRTGAPRGPWYA